MRSFKVCENLKNGNWCVRKTEDDKNTYWTGEKFVEEKEKGSFWETSNYTEAIALAEKLMTESFPENDSSPATLKHQARVKELCQKFTDELMKRANVHDQSKLEQPEKELFDTHTQCLKGLTYGSDEYKKSIESLKPALDHHYSVNRHHPEFHVDGIDGMNLIDVVELLSDWKAATERHENGDLNKSFEINQKRYGISDQLLMILKNTAKDLGMI